MRRHFFACYNLSKMKIGRIKKKRVIIIISAIFAVVAAATATTLIMLSRIDYSLAGNMVYEVNSEATVSSLFDSIRAGTLDNPDEKLDTATTGTKIFKATLTSSLGTKTTVDIQYNVGDTIAPIITGDDELTFMASDEIDVISHYAAEDNSGQLPELSIAGDYDLEETGEYLVKIVAKDASGNEATKE